MRIIAAAFVLAMVLASARSCGTDIEDKGRGEPCTRNGECAEGLQCLGGVCDVPDSGADRDGG